MQILLTTIGGLVLAFLIYRGVMSFFPKGAQSESTTDSKE